MRRAKTTPSCVRANLSNANDALATSQFASGIRRPETQRCSPRKTHDVRVSQRMRIAFFTPLEPGPLRHFGLQRRPAPHLAATTHDVDVIVEEAVWTCWAERCGGSTPPFPPGAAPVEPSGPRSPPTVAGARLRAAAAGAGVRPGGLSVGQRDVPRIHVALPDALSGPRRAPRRPAAPAGPRAPCSARGRKRDYIAGVPRRPSRRPEDLAQFVIGGLQGAALPCGRSSRPWFARPGRSRSTAPRLADELREEFPEASIETIRMGVADVPAVPAPPGAAVEPAGRAARDSRRLASSPRKKRIPQALRALAAVREGRRPTPG